MSKFDIGDKVIIELLSSWYIFEVIKKFDLKYCVTDNKGQTFFVAEDNLKLYIKEPNLVKLNMDNKELTEVSIDIKEYYELKEENEELRELLDIAKATIQMISELI